MTAAARPLAGGAAPRISRLGVLCRSAIGRKALMAVTGVVLFLFVVGHMLGNLQAFQGAESLDAPAEALRTVPALLWAMRIAIAAATVVHVVAGVELWPGARRPSRS